MSANTARLQEAKECEKTAVECLKTSMIKLKFKPDYDGAAVAMERAAVCYKNAGDVKKSIEALNKCAEYYLANGNLFHCAKSRESCAVLYRDMKQLDEAVTAFDAAIDAYAESGSLDTAAMTVEKAGEVLKTIDPKRAVAIYERGLALVQQSDRSKMASKFLKEITKIHIDSKEFLKAAASIREEIDKYVEVKETPRIGQLGIGLVLVSLAIGDSIDATKQYGWVVHHCPEMQLTEDGKVCENLIGYFEAGDDKSFQNVLKCGVLRSMDNEYLRMMKDLKAPVSAAELEEEEEDDLR